MKKILTFVFVFISFYTEASDSCIISVAHGMELKVLCSDTKIKLDSFICQNDEEAMDKCSLHLINLMKNKGYTLNTIQGRIFNGHSKGVGKYFFSK